MHQLSRQCLRVLEWEVLTAAQPRDTFGHVAAHAVGGGDARQRGQPQRRQHLAQAIENLLVVVAFILRVRTLFAEAAFRRPRWQRRQAHIAELARLVAQARLGARKAEAVDRRVGVTHRAQRIVEARLAPGIHRFTEQEDGAPVVGRLLAQQVHGIGQPIQ